MRIAVAGGTGTVGRHIVEVAESRGHEVVVLARSRGVDLVTGAGLAESLTGVEAVIDVSSIDTLSGRKAEAFFGAVTRNLLAAESAAGIGHHLALSIIGAAGTKGGHYAGKTLQEQRIAEGDVPWTILRAGQFHEFAGQLCARPPMLGLVVVPRMRSQPVAAREVAAALVDLAEQPPAGFAQPLAGPAEERMADMVRRYIAETGRKGRVVELRLPGDLGRTMASGALLATPDARLGAQRFTEWLASPDARRA